MKRTERFIIRRTKELLKNYLPPRGKIWPFLPLILLLTTVKVEQIVFCRLAPLQETLYKFFLRSATVYSVLNLGQSAVALSAIISLRKLCNHPALVSSGAGVCSSLPSIAVAVLNPTTPQKEGGEEGFSKALDLFPDDFSLNKFSASYSGTCFSREYHTEVVTLISQRQTRHSCGVTAWDQATNERQSSDCVQFHPNIHLSSVKLINLTRATLFLNIPKTLNVLEVLCGSANYPYLRLDGKTSNALRQSLVDRFNDRTSDYCVYSLLTVTYRLSLSIFSFVHNHSCISTLQ